MKARIDAGTDIAAIGAWDAGRNDAALANVSLKKLEQSWDEDCAAGKLFVIRTGGDGGGPIDIYVGELAPADVQKKFRERKKEFLLSAPSGRLVIGGLEDYRSKTAHHRLEQHCRGAARRLCIAVSGAKRRSGVRFTNSERIG